MALAAAMVGQASGQLVVGNDSSTGQLWVVDLLIPANTRQLGTGTDYQVTAAAADNSAGILYWIDSPNRLLRAPFVTTGELTPTLIGTTNIGGTSVTLSGLAWDSVANMLVAYKNNATGGAEGFYEVNPATGACTLLHAIALTAEDYGGIDYDPDTDAFYACNDSTTVASRGLYRINKPWSSPTFTLLAPYGASDTDIDGTAVGGGRVYLVNDTAAQGAQVWNIASGAYEATIAPLPFTAGNINSAGAWSPGLIPPVMGADLAIAMTDSPDPVIIPPGSNITYTITVTNGGPSEAESVQVTNTLPGNTTFVSVQPPGMHSGGIVTANLGTMQPGQQISFQVVVNPTGIGTVTNIASVSSATSDPNSLNNSATATTTVRNPQADLQAVITAPANCSVNIGETATYQFTLNNRGPDSSENTVLAVTFPDNVTFLSSLPPLTPVGNTLTLDLGTIGNGGGGSISADFRVDSGTSVVMGTAASSGTPDPAPGNNAAGHSLTIATPPSSAVATGVFSTIPTDPGSLVPNLGGARFSSTGGIQRPFVSANGSHFAVIVDTDLPTTSDQVLVVGTTTGSFAVAVQEGVTPTPESDIVGILDEVVGINDSGDYAFATNTDLATNDEVIIKSAGEILITVARENQGGPTGGYLWGATSDSVSIQNDGSVSFYSTLLNATTTTDTCYVTDDGATYLTQEGVTTPTGQAGGTTYFAGLLQTGATEGLSLSLDGSGDHWCAVMELQGAPAAENRVLVVDNDVKFQEGYVLPNSTFSSPVASTAPLMNAMMGNGDWLAYGSNADGGDWVVRNGSVIAATGEPIHTGASEVWGATFYTQTWFYAAGNPRGDYVVGGVFEGPTISNAAVVLNGERIIARENDPVDLDNNGVFDDGLYIRTFIDDRIFMTDDWLYMVVRLRDAASALCDATDTDRGQALIRIPLGSGGGCPPCAADFNEDGGVDGGDVEAFFTTWESGGGCGDVNQDGGVDGGDVEAFFTAWEAGGC